MVEDLVARWALLKQERSSWMAHWAEITRYILPRNGRYFREDRDRGEPRYNAIYDNTATRALKVLGAGMMAGATSPAQPWFRLRTADPDLNKFQPVQIWLHDVSQRMHSVFQRSNTYRVIHGIYEELGAFGTSVSYLMSSSDRVIHHYPSTTGEYCIASNYQGRIDTIYRELEKTVYELVTEFGYKNCSVDVQGLFDNRNLDAWIPIIHAIEPRMERNLDKKDNLNMPFASYYFEEGNNDSKFLRVSGYKTFPVLVPRWNVVGGDIYGNSPGMEALGDIKQLNHEQLRKAQAIDYKTQPPLQVPSSLKNMDIETLPGGISFVNPGSEQISTMFNVSLDLSHILMDIQDVRRRIDASFYSNMFLMLMNSPRGKMTATEVAERHEEKLLMLGPVIERLHNELLDPMVDITFSHMLEANLIPSAPKELSGHDLNIEFVSILAQAQRAVGTNSVDRLVSNLGMVAQFKPDVLDKFDSDQWVNAYSEMLGVDPSLIIADREVALIRKQRIQAQAMQAQTQQISETANIAKNLSQSKTLNENNALIDIINQFSESNSPPPEEI